MNWFSNDWFHARRTKTISRLNFLASFTMLKKARFGWWFLSSCRQIAWQDGNFVAVFFLTIYRQKWHSIWLRRLLKNLPIFLATIDFSGRLLRWFVAVVCGVGLLGMWFGRKKQAQIHVVRSSVRRLFFPFNRTDKKRLPAPTEIVAVFFGLLAFLSAHMPQSPTGWRAFGAVGLSVGVCRKKYGGVCALNVLFGDYLLVLISVVFSNYLLIKKRTT